MERRFGSSHHAGFRTPTALLLYFLVLQFHGCTHVAQTDPAAAEAQTPVSHGADAAVPAKPEGDPKQSQADALQRAWMGPDGAPLPFSGDDEIVGFLRTARVLDESRIPTGVTKPKKLLLEKDGVRAHAIFHYYHRLASQMTLGRDTVKHYRDTYKNQVAAYEVSRLLGMENVPPTVLREVDGREGAVGMWIENAMSEKKRRKQGLHPQNTAAVNLYTHDMRIFDYLINNGDRHLDNILFDPNWQLWLIDHTRAFSRDPSLLDISKLRKCSKLMWAKLRSLDERLIRQKLAPYMGSKEIDALFDRRETIIERLQEKISQEGENQVLFEYDTP